MCFVSSQLRPPLQHKHHLTDILFVNCTILLIFEKDLRHTIKHLKFHFQLNKKRPKQGAGNHFRVLTIFLSNKSLCTGTFPQNCIY